MKKHRGMRSQDIIILLKIALQKDDNWYIKDLSHHLKISQSEVSESLNRSRIAALISEDKKRVMKNNLLDFLEHGLRFVYPAEPGSIQRGMPTAHSAPPLKNFILSSDLYVWPWGKGEIRGQAVEPLHPEVPEVCSRDPALYELLAIVDALRLGKAREKKIAMEELQKRIG